MISSLLDFIQRFLNAFVWWTVVMPWEQAVRVRLGKTRVRLGPGLHLKVPYVDTIYRQTTRRRYSIFGPVTVTTRDGATITLSGAVGYSIADVDKLYDTLHHPEDAINSICSGAVTEYITTHDLAECQPEKVVEESRRRIRFRRFGLRTEQFVLTTYARVRTYRLIMDQHSGQWGESMSTSRVDGTP